MKRRRWLWLLGSGVALVTVALAGGARVPLYDGVEFPDEPYRYVVQSGPGQPPPPNPVQQTVPKSVLASSNLAVQSTETGPQVLWNISAGGVTLPAGATEATLSATPLAPDKAPASGKIAGNVCRLQVASQPGPPKINQQSATVSLRLPQDITFRTAPVVEFRAGSGGSWRRLTTMQTGADIYQGPFVGIGDYALVIDAGSTAPVNKSAGTPIELWLVGGIVLCLVVIVLVAVRLLGGHKDAGNRL